MIFDLFKNKNKHVKKILLCDLIINASVSCSDRLSNEGMFSVCLEVWYLMRDLHNSSVYTQATHSHETDTGTARYSQQLKEKYIENNRRSGQYMFAFQHHFPK